MTPKEFNLSPDRFFVGNNFSVRFRSLVFPAANVLTALTLQVSTRPFSTAAAAEISNFNIDLDSQQTGNISRTVNLNNFADGATLHIRWRAVSRPHYDASAPTTTSFSPSIRVKVKDGVDSIRHF